MKAEIQVKGSRSEPRFKCRSQKLRQVRLGPHWGSLKAKVVLQLPQPLRERGKPGGLQI